MEAYLPRSLVAVGWSVALFLFLLAAGFALSRLAMRTVALARLLAWSIFGAAVLAANAITGNEPPGVRMTVLIAAGLFAAKAFVTIEAEVDGMAPLSGWRWLLFAAGWLGMRPQPFGRARAVLDRGGSLILRGLGWGVLGAVFAVGARLAWLSTGSRILATALALPALSLMVHFGLCNVLAGGWRLVGFDVDALFRAPLLSTSLGEFWGRRWNLAFSEMSALGVYRPLSRVAGRPVGLLAAFLFSGLLHEMAISLPVRAGYGLPLAYFCLHGMLAILERVLKAKGRPIGGTFGRVWTLFWLAAPLPILFHPAFLAGLIWPLFGIPPMP